MIKTRHYTILLSLLILCGCIRNDIPFPVITADITKFEVVGQIQAPDINTQSREVTVYLSDTVDLNKVEVTQFEVSNDAVVSPEISTYIDLSQPVSYILSTYQEYLWRIKAVQETVRKIQVKNQVGEAIFDVNHKSILVYVTATQPREDITVEELKLGPEGSTITPDPSGVKDFRVAQYFTMTYKNREEQWKIIVMNSTEDITTGAADAWARFAYLNGTFAAGSGTPTFEYRKESETAWTTVPESEITVNGGSFQYKLSGLEPKTTYVYHSLSGTSKGSDVTFVTEDDPQIPNLSFDDWYKDGKVWYPNPSMSESDRWWDSGNRGASIASLNPTMPEESNVVKGKAARLASTTAIGVFAAGSIYLGNFVKVILPSGAELAFGKPYTARPTQLTGYYNYNPGVIDKAKAAYEYLKDTKDSCHIYMVLGDWDKPVTINTNTGTFLDTKNDPNIIAFGEHKTNQPTGGYAEFTIKLAYRNSRKPKYALIVATASKYGDYFTGSTNSVLYLDEFSLGFD